MDKIIFFFFQRLDSNFVNYSVKHILELVFCFCVFFISNRQEALLVDFCNGSHQDSRGYKRVLELLTALDPEIAQPCIDTSLPKPKADRYAKKASLTRAPEVIKVLKVNTLRTNRQPKWSFKSE